MIRLRIVLDTNVLVSAGLKPLGPQAEIMNLVMAGEIELCISEPMLTEYREVFSRRKFAHISATRFANLLAFIESDATRFTPTRQLKISQHDSDNCFYECADAAEADYIVTGNLKHFTKPYKTTKIINTRQLLELLAGRFNHPMLS